MAAFETAFDLTNQNEGGYVFDKDDPGGETYRGIARNFHPNWIGWNLIGTEKQKGNAGLSGRLDKNNGLQGNVQSFYRTEFWNSIKGDSITDQLIANKIYDMAVNMGIKQASIYLQKSINLLNRNQTQYKDITVDGAIGPATLAALKDAVKLNGNKRVLNVINDYQVKHYIELMEKNPVNEKYIGWFSRVEIVWD